jgi:2,5-diamino-6-(ribosylamino)-4(3H)-pyrimidinone 5'-phosphate reductase
MARPHVVVHVAVTLDGATTGFTPAIGRFYELARTWSEDVTLAGADTIIAQEPALREAPRTPAPAGAPLLAVVDGRGRVREWEALGAVGHWSDVLALHAESTPPRRHRAVPELVVGAQRVDLAAALAALGERHAALVVRVDSGGGAHRRPAPLRSRRRAEPARASAPGRPGPASLARRRTTGNGRVRAGRGRAARGRPRVVALPDPDPRSAFFSQVRRRILRWSALIDVGGRVRWPWTCGSSG